MMQNSLLHPENLHHTPNAVLHGFWLQVPYAGTLRWYKSVPYTGTLCSWQLFFTQPAEHSMASGSNYTLGIIDACVHNQETDVRTEYFMLT